VCAGCGAKGVRWCLDCQKKTHLIQGKLCEKCGEPLHTDRRDLCLRCSTAEIYFNQLRSYAIYREPLQTAVQQFKYKRNIGLGEIFAGKLAAVVSLAGWQVDLIFPVPLAKSRLRDRGYNQAMILARPLGWILQKPVKNDVLTRIKDTRPQVGLSLTERETNLARAIEVQDIEIAAGRNILIVDDVITTGSTMNACAKSLHEAGAGSIYGASLARAI
jgi:ComF family protein